MSKHRAAEDVAEDDGDVSVIDFRHGHLCFVSYEHVTFETIRRMAEAAELIGIPKGAQVTHVQIRQSYASGGRTASEVDLSWNMQTT